MLTNEVIARIRALHLAASLADQRWFEPSRYVWYIGTSVLMAINNDRPAFASCVERVDVGLPVQRMMILGSLALTVYQDHNHLNFARKASV